MVKLDFQQLLLTPNICVLDINKKKNEIKKYNF